MKAIKTHINTSIFILFFTLVTQAQTATANYIISFQGTWSDATHPYPNFPSNAHWSDLVGALHNNIIVFVSPGTLATTGIEDVAERGVNDAFSNEVQNAITAGNASLYIHQPFDAFSPTASASVNVTANSNFPLLSLASMIAPSPDWMIQVNSLSLIDTNGDWKPSIVMDLFPYDAGTEDGDMYEFINPESDPQELIHPLQNIAPFSNAKVGTLTITLVSLSTEDVDAKSPIQIITNSNTKSIQIYNSSRKTIEQIAVYDAIGNLVKQYATPTNEAAKTLTFPTAKSGLYFVKLQSENGIVTKKVLF
ncbi:spondin domain-containing protein [uncultured Kordia sp.]|uniref:spondin domain-containing protein n=1 Tax=uncultured Kordia sp. TaxID=507699 RepID=UPI0026076A92|nr:spondin domain-containing protein [uncultured Kordia sp.]